MIRKEALSKEFTSKFSEFDQNRMALDLQLAMHMVHDHVLYTDHHLAQKVAYPHCLRHRVHLSPYCC